MLAGAVVAGSVGESRSTMSALPADGAVDAVMSVSALALLLETNGEASPVPNAAAAEAVALVEYSNSLL